MVGGVGSDAPREGQRFSGHKVYTRKNLKGLKKNSEHAASLNLATASVAEDRNAVGVSVETVPESNGRSGSDGLVGNTNGKNDSGSGKFARELESYQHKSSERQQLDSDAQNDAQDSEPHATGTVNADSDKVAEPDIPCPMELPVEFISPSVEEQISDRSQNKRAADTEPNLPLCSGANDDEHAERQPIGNDIAESAGINLVNLGPVHLNPATNMEVPSDDSTSHMRHTEFRFGAGNGEQNGRLEKRRKMRHDRVELRRKLENDLVVVRDLVKRIEAKQGELGYGGIRGLQVPANDNFVGLRNSNLEIGLPGAQRAFSSPVPTFTTRQSRPASILNLSVVENGRGFAEGLEKEKRTPKANQFYRNSEFLLAKDKIPPAESNKKSKANVKRLGTDSVHGFGPNTKVYKSCSTLLERLMKHKHGWVFNSPVDVEGLGLHDYHSIIKYPMDLGTIKTRLIKNWYKAPEEFAEDVRLTFSNAMTYNPKGQDVHVMAEQLLTIFEEKWANIKLEYDREMGFFTMYNMGFSTPQPRRPPPLPVDARKILQRSESMAYPSSVSKPKTITTNSGRIPAPKKPKAKDLNKRDMTYEEKQKLSANLQGLPPEKLDNIVQIIKKRNSTLYHHDDEIEVDIDSVDAETLWELDRFVTNYKKSLSKSKRRAELATQARVAAENKAQEAPPSMAAVPPNKTHTNTDEKFVSTSSPLQEERQGDRHSKSSSSSSSSSDSGSSSSDSDSDSDSSSGSGSDVGHSE